MAKKKEDVPVSKTANELADIARQMSDRINEYELTTAESAVVYALMFSYSTVTQATDFSLALMMKRAMEINQSGVTDEQAV